MNLSTTLEGRCNYSSCVDKETRCIRALGRWGCNSLRNIPTIPWFWTQVPMLHSSAHLLLPPWLFQTSFSFSSSWLLKVPKGGRSVRSGAGGGVSSSPAVLLDLLSLHPWHQPSFTIQTRSVQTPILQPRGDMSSPQSFFNFLDAYLLLITSISYFVGTEFVSLGHIAFHCCFLFFWYWHKQRTQPLSSGYSSQSHTQGRCVDYIFTGELWMW